MSSSKKSNSGTTLTPRTKGRLAPTLHPRGSDPHPTGSDPSPDRVDLPAHPKWLRQTEASVQTQRTSKSPPKRSRMRSGASTAVGCQPRGGHDAQRNIECCYQQILSDVGRGSLEWYEELTFQQQRIARRPAGARACGRPTRGSDAPDAANRQADLRSGSRDTINCSTPRSICLTTLYIPLSEW